MNDKHMLYIFAGIAVCVLVGLFMLGWLVWP